MACTKAVTQAITNNCASMPASGLKVKAWIFNRADIDSITHDGSNNLLITAITMTGAKTAFAVTVSKREMNAGYDAVISDNMPDVYTNYWSIEPWAKDSDSLKQLSEMNDVMLIVETNGPKAEGVFEAYGLENGLWKSSASKRANDNRGVPTFEFTSQSGQEESVPNYVFWSTDYATTLAALEALE